MDEPRPLSKEQRAILEHQIRDVLGEVGLKEALAARVASPSKPDLNSWPGRAQALWTVINQPGGLAIVILAVGLLLYTGYLPSPLTRAEAKIDAHAVGTAQLESERRAFYAELAKTLGRMADGLAKSDRRAALRECDGIKDPEFRRKCVE